MHKNGKKVALYKENLLLRGCTIRNTEVVSGIVIYAGKRCFNYSLSLTYFFHLPSTLCLQSCGSIPLAGHETKALLNNSGPRYKRSKLERQMNVDVLWCVLILFTMCLFSAIGKSPSPFSSYKV